jgi:Peptidase M15/Mannosyl-glycoprotein endo-beta-N-acetylglucosaminidase
MAYLPTVNEIKDESLTKEDYNKITKSLKARFKSFDVPAKFLTPIAINTKHKNSTVQKDSDSGIDILERLYKFIVQDTFKKTRDRKLEEKRTDNLEKQEDDRQVELMTAVAESSEVEKEDKEEGIFWKLWRYFGYFRAGRFVYRHWEEIEKFLGIEGLGKTIKSIGDDIGITGVVDRIKKTIDDIIGGFSIRGEQTVVPDMSVPKINQKEYIKQILPYAEKAAKELNVPVEAILSQAVQESGYGTGVHNYNLFNVTASKSYKGAVVERGDTDKYGRKITQRFKAFKDYGEAFEDYTSYIKRRQSQAIGATSTLEYGQKLKAGGYAEDPDYAPHVAQHEQKMKKIVSEVKKEPNTDTFVGPVKPEEKKTEVPKQEFVGPVKPEEKKTEVPKQEFVGPVKPDDSATRLPKNKLEQEKGETGANAPSGDIPTNDQGIADDNDIKNLKFLHPEQRFILKIFAKKLQQLRSELGYEKFIITSGYRSKEYNESIGGAKDSCHTKRIAADIIIAPSTEMRVQFIRAASRLGFGGIGVYKSFIHVDLGKRRTWPTGIRLPQEIVDALRDHVSQTTTQERYDVPKGLESERGELGPTKEGQPLPDVDEGEREMDMKAFDPIKEMMDYLESGMSMIGKLSSTVSDTKNLDLFKNKLESIISKNTDIPRKEVNVPKLDASLVQSNITQFFVDNKKYYTDTTSDFDDSPPTLRQFRGSTEN